MEKQKLAVFNPHLIKSEMIKYQAVLSNVFQQMKKQEVEFCGMFITVVHSEPEDYEKYELEKELPGLKMARAKIYAQFRVGERFQEVFINDFDGAGVPFKLPQTLSEFHVVENNCSIVANEIANLIYENGKEVTLLMERFVNPGKDEVKLLFWTHLGDTNWFIGTSYLELSRYLGTDDGVVLITTIENLTESKKSFPRGLNASEVVQLLQKEKGFFGDPVALREAIEKEARLNRRRLKILKALS